MGAHEEELEAGGKRAGASGWTYAGIEWGGESGGGGIEGEGKERKVESMGIRKE